MGLGSWLVGVLKENWEETKANALDIAPINIVREVGYFLTKGETPAPIFVNFDETSLKRKQITNHLQSHGITVHKSIMSGKFLILDVSNDDRDGALSVLAASGIPVTQESPAPIAVFEGLQAMGLVSSELVQEVKSRRGEYPVKSHGAGVALAKQLREQGLKARVDGTLLTGFKVRTW